MKIPVLLAALGALVATFAGVDAACTNPQVRKEWREYSSAEKQAYIDAVKLLVNRKMSNQYSDPTTMSYYDFVSTHTSLAYWAHNNAQFYPYHRAMLHQWNLALKSAGWMNGPVYWDWTTDSQNIFASDVFSSQWFGGGGVGPNNCVKDGQFSADTYQVSPFPATIDIAQASPYDRGFPIDNSEPYAKTCLRRCWPSPDNPNSAHIAWSPEALYAAITVSSLSDYDAFRLISDGVGWHADLHAAVGGRYVNQNTCGDMANGAWSTNDPVFFLHHGMIDKVWSLWQAECPSFRNSYDGNLNTNGGANPDPITTAYNFNGTAFDTQHLDSWPFYVKDMLDTQNDLLCYTYSTSAVDAAKVPFQATCPVEDPSDHWFMDQLYSLVTSNNAKFARSGSNTVFDQYTSSGHLTGKPWTAPKSSIPAAIRGNDTAMRHFIAQTLIAEDDRVSVNAKTGLASYSRSGSHHAPPSHQDFADLDRLRATYVVSEEALLKMGHNVEVRRALEALNFAVTDSVNEWIEKGVYESKGSLRSQRAANAGGK
ncbi:hypothetical protein HDU76_001988 [Blyttiomyces sp. JEL0837]|nr:hypothetical protein HDU76_001988 [Blyttiomyces sp. JEL0837]